MKKILFVLLLCAIGVQGQQVEGKLTLNGKSKTEIKLDNKSTVQLFKEFKTRKHQLHLNFEAKEIPKNRNGETIVLFEFKTELYKNGKLVKNIVRKQPIPYFPGDMDLPAETFDFISLLTFQSWDDLNREEGSLGMMSKEKYTVKLYATPLGFSGEISPIVFQISK